MLSTFTLSVLRESLQEPLQTPKSTDARVPFVKWCTAVNAVSSSYPQMWNLPLQGADCIFFFFSNVSSSSLSSFFFVWSVGSGFAQLSIGFCIFFSWPVGIFKNSPDTSPLSVTSFKHFLCVCHKSFPSLYDVFQWTKFLNWMSSNSLFLRFVLLVSVGKRDLYLEVIELLAFVFF